MIRLLALLMVLLTAPSLRAETLTRFSALDRETRVLTIRSTTDLDVMRPLIEAFRLANPGVAVVYGEHLSNELVLLAGEACRNHRPIADVLVTSSSDHAVKLVNDGCARPHVSAETRRTPAYAQWLDSVFGFTFEPAVIVWDQRAVPPEEVPRSHLDLVALLRDKGEAYRGAVGTYDVATSGIGYLFAVMDARQSNLYGRLIEAFGRAAVRLECCTSGILDAIERGELKIGYNLLGSYAYRRLAAGAPIGIALPRDYTLVLTRAAMLPRVGFDPGLGAAFLDHLLSEEGQRIVAERAFHFAAGRPIPPGVEGPASDDGASLFRPITIGPSLLAVQDAAKRRRFLSEWNASMSRD